MSVLDPPKEELNHRWACSARHPDPAVRVGVSTRRPVCNRPVGHDGDHMLIRPQTFEVRYRWPQRVDG